MCLNVAIGADFARQRCTDVDSVTAGQITANFIRRLSNVLQIITAQNDDYVYRPHLAWTNIGYQVPKDLAPP